jgi:CspA family cold shock protein
MPKEVVDMPTGHVKWFDPKKGYGFILGEEGQDVFVHYTAIQGEGFRYLKDGENVQYELVRGEKGLQARNVVRPEAPASGAAEPSPSSSA